MMLAPRGPLHPSVIFQIAARKASFPSLFLPRSLREAQPNQPLESET